MGIYHHPPPLSLIPNLIDTPYFLGEGVKLFVNRHNDSVFIINGTAGIVGFVSSWQWLNNYADDSTQLEF